MKFTNVFYFFILNVVFIKIIIIFITTSTGSWVIHMTTISLTILCITLTWWIKHIGLLKPVYLPIITHRNMICSLSSVQVNYTKWFVLHFFLILISTYLQILMFTMSFHVISVTLLVIIIIIIIIISRAHFIFIKHNGGNRLSWFIICMFIITATIIVMMCTLLTMMMLVLLLLLFNKLFHFLFIC